SLARILGKSRSHIANTLRLLTLPKIVKDYLNEGKLSAGHGRTLVGAEDPEALAQVIIGGTLNVRQAETLSKQRQTGGSYIRSPGEADPEKEVLKQHLSDLIGLPIDLNLKGTGGKIVISFKNPMELDKIIQKFNLLTDNVSMNPKTANFKLY
ncbi:MAG TPA: hypothetical protein VMW10_05995, partial [Alphaproteobacteria bacterium]|nr:hypothetical protein [Alphaproteobacteria bacterium]